ncbi:hypothetical protein [Streptomyces sp. NBC_01803]|uniref:hypothetical protein n=1 Tax=Streptomyces sp. NBC_01803 TaxID=2975946 RepID=UPI002DDAC853|nr:hypothetical protein [Streptomyces sp. NBC_01803]WSA42881.1 hypothetical protein OIE51_00870 [Streptomyces sp. NBC_01803]
MEHAHPSDLPAGQRRLILSSDPVTGRLDGPERDRGRLVARGLAVVHGQLGGTYLTEAGRVARDRLADAGRETGTAAPPGEAGVFTAAPGDQPGWPWGDPGARAAVVARAWAGAVDIRRVFGTAGGGDDPGRPAPWERERMVWAVSLALEVAGLPPCAVDRTGRLMSEGYRVTESDEKDRVRVEWRAVGAARAGVEDRLARCAAGLAERGWEALAYRASRGKRFLLVSPLP